MIPAHLQEVANKVRPMRDNVVWSRIEYKNPAGLELPNVRLNRGIVLAVGSGRRIRRMINVPVAAGQFHKAEIGAETGRVRPMTVQPGDCLEFSQYGQTEFEVDGHKLVLSGEQSVIGYADPKETEGLMFPAPAGFDDRNRKVVGKF